MKQLLFAAFTICFSMTLFSQVSNVNDDFEGNGNITTWAEDGCTIDIAFSNPYPEGINTSNTVLKYDDTGGQYANVRFQTSENFDLSSNSTFSLKIYIPSASITGIQPNQISLKLQDGTITQPWTTQSEIIKPLALDQWQEVTFNFATDNYINLDGNSPDPTTRTDFNRVLLQINSENNSDFVTAYIDDFLYDATAITTLSDLQIDNATIADFLPNIVTYDIELPIGTTLAPLITLATPTDVNASSTITQASSIPGSASVLVTASNGVSTQTYTVLFTESTTPASDAPTPPERVTSDVISIFSEAYTNISGVNLNPDWSQSGFNTANTAFEIVSGSGNLSLEYPNFNYQGIDWSATPQDISEMEFLHVDIWTNDTTPNVYVISSGDEIAHPIVSQQGSWQSLDIPVTDITADLTAAIQFKFDGGTGGKIYIDNLYFWKEETPCGEDTDNSETFTNSNLPIIIIETLNGETIPDEPKILGTMKIIQRPDGARNFVCDVDNEDYLDYSGTIGIETRGSSSQTLPKKPYGIDTLEDDGVEDDNVELLGMPKENDWLLNSFAFDDSMMRDFISYEMAREMGQYAVNLKYCEVIINGDYRGLYALSEKIKRDGDRVDVAKLDDDENTLPEVTGGYIMQTDRPSDEDPEAWFNNGAGYIHEKPNSDDITTDQSSYIESVFLDLDDNANNSDIIGGYPSVIDVPSFVDYMLVAEIASNVDAYALSTYYHKDRSSKLRAGPVWDYNLTYGNDLFQWGFDRSFTDVWQFEYSNTGALFWNDLFAEPTFKCYLSKRFNEVTNTGQPLNYDYISDLIDSTVALISEAVVREDERWDTIEDFSGEITNMKTWIQERITWMTSNLGDFSSCNMVETPSLVITKIDYNPQETTAFPESDDLEFIEIQNTGSTIVDLTGIYFIKLGVSYQFPENSTIAAGEVVYLAADATTFENKYGFAPFDTFTRDLSNKSHNLVLVDAFGNIIDEVEYFDKTPWPESADGDGFYLELINTNLDNSLASSWMASSAVLSTNSFENNKLDFALYPNPVEEKLIVNSRETIEEILVFNLLGQHIKDFQVNFTSGEINLSELNKAAYIIKIKLIDGSSVSRMIFKK